MSLTDRELIQMALEALEYIHEGANNQGPHTGISWRCVSNKAEPAITALRERLKELEQKPQAYLDTGLGAFYWSREFPKGPPPGFAPVYIDYSDK